jgi:hypothetical protein
MTLNDSIEKNMKQAVSELNSAVGILTRMVLESREREKRLDELSGYQPLSDGPMGDPPRVEDMATMSDLDAYKFRAEAEIELQKEISVLKRELEERAEQIECLNAVVKDCAMIIRRLASRNPEDPFSVKAMDFLNRKNLQGEILRSNPKGGKHDGFGLNRDIV